MTIVELRNRVKTALDVINPEALAMSDEMIQDMYDFNVERLWEGNLKTGDRITPDYADSTIEEKKRNGQPYDRVTLKDTGDMYSFLFIKVQNGEILFDSQVDYTENLRKKYSDEIFGLTDENKADLREKSRELILRKFREITDL